MAKKSSKPRDTNSMAAAIVAQATDPEDQGDDPHDADAADRGRKGGAARATALSPARRSEIARKAAAARWSESSAQDAQEER